MQLIFEKKIVPPLFFCFLVGKIYDQSKWYAYRVRKIYKAYKDEP